MNKEDCIKELMNIHQNWLSSLSEDDYEKNGEEVFIEWLKNEVNKVENNIVKED